MISLYLNGVFDVSQQTFANTVPNEKILPLSQLAHITEEQQGQVIFYLLPSLVVHHSHSAAYSLKQAIDSEHLDDLDIHQAESGIITCLASGEVLTEPYHQDTLQLLQHIQTGDSLQQIPSHLLNQLEAIVQRQLVIGFSCETPLNVEEAL